MTFATIQSALRAARKFHKAYGVKGNQYICVRNIRRACGHDNGGYLVEVWQRGVNGFYFATLV